MMKKSSIAVLALLCLSQTFCKKPAEIANQESEENVKTNAIGTKPNVLLIIVDDLRYWSIKRLYDDDLRTENVIPITPKLNELIDDPRSVWFTNAHAPAIACTPSRTAFLSGKYPNETGIYRNGQDWTSAIQKNQTIFKAFRGDANYMVYGAGKVFHDNPEQAQWVLGDGHNQTFYANRFLDTEHLNLAGPTPIMGTGAYQYRFLGTNEEPVDKAAADFCIDKMVEMKNSYPNKSFFITCGFRAPHTPYILNETKFNNANGNSPKMGRPNDLTEMGTSMLNCGPSTSPTVLKANDPTQYSNYLKAYQTMVEMLDVQVGKLLKGLDDNGFANNTIVLLVSDHGFHLGEKDHIKKNTMYEETTRVPMIWRVPGSVGGKRNTVVDLMSIYPTLKAFCGLTEDLGSNGRSLKGLIENGTTTVTDPYALTVAAATTVTGGTAKVIARVRSQDWSLIKYNLTDNTSSTEELFNNSTDPWENVNLRPNASGTANTKLVELRGKISTLLANKVLPQNKGTIDVCD